MGWIARGPHAFSARCGARGSRRGPRGVPLGARITGSDWADGGLTPDDAVTLGKVLKDVGLDYIDVSSGGVTAEIRTPTSPGYNAPIAERLRRETGMVVRSVGMITTAKQAEAIVAEGKADMVALARAFLDNPHWGWHAAQALSADVARPVQYQRSARLAVRPVNPCLDASPAHPAGRRRSHHFMLAYRLEQSGSLSA
jgi:2,4-dienoyl-CoA reductase-like NADH-dependent reductase (Old Yellow Enzyme family)